MSLGAALMVPTRLYVKSALEAIRTGAIKGLAHITGGGITENLPRILADGLCAEIDLTSFAMPAVFSWLAQTGNIAPEEMLRTFNCGLGLIAVCDAEKAGHAIDAFGVAGERAYRIGRLIGSEGAASVRYQGALPL
jgi:phosphoribosylformylglycinamidine cyclo-ligase